MRSCGICAKHRVQRAAELVIKMDVPQRQWKKIAMDPFLPQEKNFWLLTTKADMGNCIARDVEHVN